jgi:sterol desaturase/sphingolipid hydroxylase (fatty acid hydroxylase superfamily)
MIPMAIIFKFEAGTLFWISYLISMQGLMIHMNVNLDFGRFNVLTVSPNMHRLHHSSLPEHQDKNFAAIFTIFDRIFGTYMAPDRGQFAPPTGTHDNAHYGNLVHAHVYPFIEGPRLLRGLARQSGTLTQVPTSKSNS